MDFETVREIAKLIFAPVVLQQLEKKIFTEKENSHECPQVEHNYKELHLTDWVEKNRSYALVMVLIKPSLLHLYCAPITASKITKKNRSRTITYQPYH